MRRTLITADLLALTSAFVLAEVRFGLDGAASGHLKLLAESSTFAAALPCWVLVTQWTGLYDRDEHHPNCSTVDELLAVLEVVTVGTWLFYVAARATGLAEPTFEKLVSFWLLATGLVAVGRVAGRAIAHARSSCLERAVIVGAGYVGQLLARKLKNHPEYGIELVGFVDGAAGRPAQSIAGVPRLGDLASLPTVVQETQAERVLIAYSMVPDDELLPLVRQLRKRDVRIDIVPRFFELIGPGAVVHDLEGLLLMGVPPARSAGGSARLKRVLDIVTSGLALVAVTPLLAVIAVAIRLETTGPIFYRHRRIGRNGRSFDLFKFRTMYAEHCRGANYGGEAAERAFEQLMQDASRKEEFARTFKLSADPRVTRVGRVLRRWSLDELPQLVNAFRGDISLVGPRPVTLDELERYGEDVDLLLGVRPGITGYWQINGRSNTNYVERVRLDLAYLRDQSLALDLKILAKTAKTLRSRNGAC